MYKVQGSEFRWPDPTRFFFIRDRDEPDFPVRRIPNVTSRFPPDLDRTSRIYHKVFEKYRIVLKLHLEQVNKIKKNLLQGITRKLCHLQ